MKRKLGELIKISDKVLAAEHPDFTIKFKDNKLSFECSGFMSYELYCRDYIKYSREKQELTFEEIAYSQIRNNATALAGKIAGRFLSNFEDGDYDHTEISDQCDLLFYYVAQYNNYKYSMLKSLEDITEKVPLAVFANVVNTMQSNQKPEVILKYDGLEVSGILNRIIIQQSMMGIKVTGTIKVISKAMNGYVEGFIRVPLRFIPMIKNIEELGLTLVTEEIKKRLTERGMKYIKYTEKPSYCHCNGFGMSPGLWEDTRSTIKSRVMIDVVSMKMINPRVDDEWYLGDIFDYNEDETSEVPSVNNDDLWRTSPAVYGFVFNNKIWCRMNIDDISDIKFSQNAFDELIVPDYYKQIFLASLTNPMPSLDSIEDKGEGKIFLLYGAPGVGKTMTAESVAEYLKKPLYYVSVGELGVDPASLEESLDRVMQIAINWDAIILLDEVDVFAVNRDGASIERNAMTAIFLRMLERYSGIMFMTTNLLDNLDPAFLSRSTAVVKYESLSVNDRITIWTKILDKAAALNGVEIQPAVYENIPFYAEEDVNGRVIKNTVRLAYSLALSSKDKIMTPKHIQDVLSLGK